MRRHGKCKSSMTKELVSLDSLVVDAPDPTAGVMFPASELVGEAEVKEMIWECLMGDKVQKIAVCGIGGVGKTAIMMHIYNELLKKRKFDKVIWVTVSKEFDIIKLQKNIASALNEDISKYVEKQMRAGVLKDIWEKQVGRYVLILDNVWEEDFPLDYIGIHGTTLVSKGCKLVLTTRSIRVGRQVGCEIIKVEPLPEENALRLFLKKVGYDINEDLMSILKLILKECSGLPFAIVRVAGSLKGESDISLWRNALNELREPTSIKGVGNNVFNCLKSSYDHLKDSEFQNCFLYCAVYPEDFEIEKEELIEYWIVEGLIIEMTWKPKKDRGHFILNELEENGLLESIRGGRYVKMHDLVRDMALHITSENPRFMIKAGMQLEELPNEKEWKPDLQKASLMRNSISRIAEDMSPLCERLSTLLLQKNLQLSRIPESFFMHMHGLQYLDLSETGIEDLPMSMFDLKNLTTLLLRFCYRLRHLHSLSKLQQLEKLDLGYSSLEEVPQGMGTLIKLWYLDLSIQTSGNKGLNLKAEEVVELSNLKVFRGTFHNLHGFNMFVNSVQDGRRLSNYFLSVGNHYFSASNKEKDVEIFKQNISGNLLVLPTNIQGLGIRECHDIRSLNDIWSFDNCTDLRECRIWNSEDLECVISLRCRASLESLEMLELRGLKKLNALFYPTSAPLRPTTFSCLKRFELGECSNIKKLLLPGWLPNLQKLEVIRLRSCLQLVEMIASDDDHEERNIKKEKNIDRIRFILPRLKELRFSNLPELKSICSTSEVIVCNSLERIFVDGCSNLKRIPLSLNLLDNGQPYPLPSLRSINASRKWWESLEWDNPNFTDILQPLFQPPF